MLSGAEEFTCHLYGSGPQLKQVDEAREIKVKKMCGSNLELRPGLSIDRSTVPPCKRALLQQLKSQLPSVQCLSFSVVVSPFDCI